VDVILESRETTTLRIAEPMPVYVTYFTAVSDGLGGALLLDDIYNRDGAIRVSALRAPARISARAEGLGPRADMLAQQSLYAATPQPLSQC